MEIGDYIRINGIIGKVEQVGNSLFWIEDGSSYSLSDKSIKYSKNVTNLIKVGDILKINNKKYEVVFDESIGKIGLLIPNEKQLAVRHCSLKYVFSKNGIEEFKNIEILTKEQYEVNCYKLGR